MELSIFGRASSSEPLAFPASLGSIANRDMTTCPYATPILSSIEHPCMAVSAGERTFFGRPVPRIADLVLVSLENTLVVRAYGMTQLTPENKPTPRRTRNIQLLRQRSGFG
jgi:hypothetical protein